jgi:hypothetical protein
MKKTTIYGIAAFDFSVAYFLAVKEENDKGLEGIEIKINPKKLLDGALAMSGINPIAQEGIRRVAGSVINKYYED